MTKKALPLDLHRKKQPIKRGDKRRKLRTFFRKFLNYMKSDTYMYSPLISHQSDVATTFLPASSGFGEPIKKHEKYLEFDCYMYASMLLDSAVETPRAPAEQSSEKPMRDFGNRMDKFREIVSDDCDIRTKRIAVKHTLATKETIKHVVHKKCRPTPNPGIRSTPVRDWQSSRKGGIKKKKTRERAVSERNT